MNTPPKGGAFLKKKKSVSPSSFPLAFPRMFGAVAAQDEALQDRQRKAEVCLANAALREALALRTTQVGGGKAEEALLSPRVTPRLTPRLKPCPPTAPRPTALLPSRANLQMRAPAKGAAASRREPDVAREAQAVPSWSCRPLRAPLSGAKHDMYREERFSDAPELGVRTLLPNPFHLQYLPERPVPPPPTLVSLKLGPPRLSNSRLSMRLSLLQPRLCGPCTARSSDS